jgi:hypothetical protein
MDFGAIPNTICRFDLSSSGGGRRAWGQGKPHDLLQILRTAARTIGLSPLCLKEEINKESQFAFRSRGLPVRPRRQDRRRGGCPPILPT